MEFCEKLDFLMNLTSTSNSSLALYACLDPSHVSRLRRGERKVSRNESYIRKMAVYFARHCTGSYQLDALRGALGVPSDPSGADDLSERIFQFLSGWKNSGEETVGRFLEQLSSSQQKKLPDLRAPERAGHCLPETGVSIFYGPAGKQQAVVEFLSLVAACPEPRTLLLFSDEDIDWLIDASFVMRWSSLMSQVIARGNRLRIIHTVSRNLDEMLAAITQWLPLYMSGAIEPYFYPKKRDGIYKRTLFIAPGLAAVVSTSVGGSAAQAANLLFTDARSVSAFAEEYRQYLNLCKPLMRIFVPKDRERYLATLLEFEREPADCIIRSGSLSLLTMPEKLIDTITSRLNLPAEKAKEFHKKRLALFDQALRTNRFAELIRLPTPSAVTNGEVKLALSDMLGGGAAYYTQEEYLSHLEHLILLLETRENFHAYFLDSAKEGGYSVYVKDGLGALVSKTSDPPIVLAVNEGNMTAAFWDFLVSLVGTKNFAAPNNPASAEKLRAYLRQF